MKYGEEYYLYAKDVRNCDGKCKGDWQKRYAEYISRIFPRMNESSKLKILDFGCCLGNMTSGMIDAGMDVVGLDIDQWYVDNCPFENMIGRIFTYDGKKFPFSPNRFDCIHASQTLEHIPLVEIPGILKEFKRTLVKNGIVYISVPDPAIDFNSDPTHITMLTVKEWEVLLQRAGFRIITSIFEPKWKDEPMFKEYNWVQIVAQK